MRFRGVRRARVITLLLVLVVLAGLGRLASVYVRYTLGNLGPTLVARLSKELKREVQVDRLQVDKPGYLLIEGIRVARKENGTLKQGTLATVRRLEVRYDPRLWDTSALLARFAGRDMRAQVRAEGIRFWPPKGPYEELFRADAVTTMIDLGPLLTGADVVPTIARVDIYRPHAFIRRGRDRKWNFEELLKPEKPEKPVAFRGEIVAHNGVVDVVDYISGALPTPVRSRVAINLKASLAAFPLIEFSTAGAIGGPAAATFAVSGHTQKETKQFFASLRAQVGNLSFWHKYQGSQVEGLRSVTGTAGVVGSVWGTASGKPEDVQYKVNATLRDVTLAHRDLPEPVRIVSGSAAAGPDLLAVDGNAVAAGIPVTLNAWLSPKQPLRAQARVSATNVTVAAVRRLYPKLELPKGLSVPSPLAFFAFVAGEKGGWSVRGTAAVPEIRYEKALVRKADVAFEGRVSEQGDLALKGTLAVAAARQEEYSARDLRAGFTVRGRNQKLVVHASARLKALGGELNASGWIDAREEEPRFYAAGEVRTVDLSLLPLKNRADLKDLKLKGLVSAEFVASGSAKAPVASAYVRATSLVANEEQLDEITARVRYADDVLTIQDARITDRRAQASVWGTLSDLRGDGVLDLHVESQGIDLPQILATRVKEKISGTAYASLDVTGTFKQPVAEGEVQVYKPVYQEHVADYAEARIRFKDLGDRLELEAYDLRLVQAPARVVSERVFLTRAKVDGREMQPPWQIQGTLTAEGLSLVRVARLAGMTVEKLRELPFGGDIGPVRIQVSGPEDALVARFDASLENLNVQGFDLGRVDAAGSFDVAKRRLTLEKLTSTSRTVRTGFSGTLQLPPDDPKQPGDKKQDELAKNAVLDFHFSADDLRLLPVLRKYAPELLKYVDLRGMVKHVEGRVTGKGSAPKATMTVELANVLVNERAVAIEPFKLEWQPAVAQLQNFRAQLGSGSVELPFAVALLDEPGKNKDLLRMLSGYLRVRSVPIAVVRQLVQDSPFYREKAGREVRDALRQWRAAVGGDISADIGISAGGSGPAPGAPRTLPGLPPRQALPPRLTGEIKIPNLASPPGPGQPLTSLTTNFFYEGGRFELTRFHLAHAEGGVVTASGFHQETQAPGGTMQFDLKAEKLGLPVLARLPVAGLKSNLEPLQPLDGEINATATIKGSSERPEVAFNVGLDRPVAAGIPMDRLVLTNGKYSATENALTIGSLQLLKKIDGDSPAPLVTATGKLPLVWPRLTMPPTAARNLEIRVPERPLSALNAIANDADRYARERGDSAAARVRPVTDLVRQIAATQGVMRAIIRLAGSQAAPQNGGYFQLDEGALRHERFDTEVKNLNIRIDLLGDRIQLTRVTGESSHHGNFEVRGDVTLANNPVPGGEPTAHVDIGVDLKEFVFVEKRGQRLLGDAFKGTTVRGQLDTVDPKAPGIHQPISIRGDWPSPPVSGGVKLDNALLAVVVGEVQPSQGSAVPLNIPLDLTLLMGDNVYFKNPAARLKLEGSLIATQTVQAPLVMGTIVVRQGTLSLPMMRLRNVHGTVRVAYDGRAQDIGVESATPVTVDLSASTTLRLQRASNQEAEYFDATIQITGSPGARRSPDGVVRQASSAGGFSLGSDSGLTITVRTDPPLPGSEIEALIRQQLGVEGIEGSGTNVVQALGTQIENALSVSVTSALTGRIEDLLQSRLGLDIVSIDVGITQPLRVRLGKKLFNRVYGTVTQELNTAEGQRTTYELYYRLSPYFRVGYRKEVPRNLDTIYFSGTKTFR